ncbi:MAG: radical SAM protein [Candidatus Omnitrophota bacterium]|jgi:MoaA/NifB/PqqE/SkfB family radical SAM enzyme
MGRAPTQEFNKELNENYQEGTLTCLKSPVIKKRINPEFPLVLNIEPTNDCNLRCYYCPRLKSKKPVGYISLKLAKKIIDEAADYPKLIMLNFHKDGEPLLHPKIGAMIKYAHKKKIAEVIHMNTNAACLDDKMIKKLLDSGIDDITFSIDAYRQDTFKKTKGRDLLPLVVSNLKRFIELRDKGRYRKPFLRAKIIEFDDTADEVNDFYNFWDGLADEVQVTGIHSWSGAIKNLRVTDPVSKKRFPCILLWYALVINWTGDVSICSVDWNTSSLVGNVNTTAINQIWKGDILRQARRDELCGRHDAFDVCKKCINWVGGEDLTGYLKTRTEFL